MLLAKPKARDPELGGETPKQLGCFTSSNFCICYNSQ